MSWYIPEFDKVDASGRNIPDAGDHDFTFIKFEGKQSSGGNDMMVVDLAVDNGESCGHQVTEYVVFGMKGMMGEAKLKRMLDAAGLRWQQAPSLEAFVAQFKRHEGTARVGATIEHQYSIKRGQRGDWENVDLAVFEAHSGDKNVRAVPTGNYFPVKAARELTIATGEVMTPAGASGDGGVAAVADDKIPF